MNQTLIAIDQAINTRIKIPGDGLGWADETLSARLWRCWLQGLLSDRWYRAVDALFFWQPNHCYESWRSEIERAHLPNHYRLAAVTAGDTTGSTSPAREVRPSSSHP